LISVTLAMRLTPPKIATPTTAVSAMPVHNAGMPNASSSDEAAVNDCRPTNAMPKVSSNSTE